MNCLDIRLIKTLLNVALLLGPGLTRLYAQESVNSTGGNISGSGGSISYSLGQLSYHTHNGTNASLAEGVQHAYEISVVAGRKEAKNRNLSVLVYPNPTINYLILSIDEFDISNLSYRLYDMNGKLLQHKKITNTQTNIAMANLVATTYIVKIIQDNKEVKTYKIIKQ
jgi:hypothetical protein